MLRQEALTVNHSGLVNKIIIPVTVTNDKGVSKVFPGLIDTGATNTCVSFELATELELTKVGVIDSGTAGGKVKANLYIVDLSLCDGRIIFKTHKVLSANLTEQLGVEMLIGMDILLCGDFAITHKNGKTKASFRVPSLASYDFVADANINNKFEEEKARRDANRQKKGGKKKKHR